MKRTAIVALFAALMMLATLAALPAPARDDKAPDTKEIMKKVGSPTGLFFDVAKELKENDPMWEEVQQKTKEISKLLESLGKATPPKGDKDSWAKLTKAYADNAKNLEKAAAKMDLKTARDFSEKMKNSCTACHKVHRISD
jgi:cytochrome c556